MGVLLTAVCFGRKSTAHFTVAIIMAEFMANRISLSARDSTVCFCSFLGGMRARARDVTNHRVFFLLLGTDEHFFSGFNRASVLKV